MRILIFLILTIMSISLRVVAQSTEATETTNPNSKAITSSGTPSDTSSQKPSVFQIPELTSPIMDEANLVEPKVYNALDEAIRVLREAHRTQLTVFTFASLQGQTIEEVGIKTAEKWKLGEKGKAGSSDESLDRGVILLVALQEHKIRIEVSRGLEASLTDLVAKRIIDEKIKPLFKEGRMSDGILVGVYSIAQVTDPDVDLAPYLQGQRRVYHRQSDKMPISQIIILIIIFVIGIIRIGGGRGGGGFWWGGGGFGGGGFGGGGSGGGGWSGGGSSGFNGGGASGDW